MTVQPAVVTATRNHKIHHQFINWQIHFFISYSSHLIWHVVYVKYQWGSIQSSQSWQALFAYGIAYPHSQEEATPHTKVKTKPVKTGYSRTYMHVQNVVSMPSKIITYSKQIICWLGEQTFIIGMIYSFVIIQ